MNKLSMPVPMLDFDPDRFVQNMEASKLPFPRIMAAVLFYARLSDCYYRKMQIGPMVQKGLQ